MMKIWILVTAVVYLNAVSANYYCKYQCNGKKHTMCLYESEALSSRCKNVETNVLKPEEKDEIVKLHNALRLKHGQIAAKYGLVGPVPAEKFQQLIWSDELATIAQRWANQCIDGHDQCRTSYKTKHVGQNVAKGHGDVKDLVNSWFGDLRVLESGKYNQILDQNERYKVTGQATRYSSFIWGEGRELGCGVIKTVQGETTLVCNYGPTSMFIDYP